MTERLNWTDSSCLCVCLYVQLSYIYVYLSIYLSISIYMYIIYLYLSICLYPFIYMPICHLYLFVYLTIIYLHLSVKSVSLPTCVYLTIWIYFLNVFLLHLTQRSMKGKIILLCSLWSLRAQFLIPTLPSMNVYGWDKKLPTQGVLTAIDERLSFRL